MAGKSRSHAERVARILDNLGEHIRTAPGEELLEAAREDGRDPAEISSRVKGLLRRTLKAYQQKALAEAREGYERELASMHGRKYELPRTVQGRRKWLDAILSQVPQLLPAFTLQNREFAELTDDDVEAYLKKLVQLGVLDAVSLPELE